MPQAQTLNSISSNPEILEQRVANLETALRSDETMIVVESPSGDQNIVGGRLILSQLANPSAPTVTPEGTAGSTSYSYEVVAVLGTATSAASAAGSTSTGNATLSATNYNLITFAAVAGATSYNIYRTVGGATQGKIGSTSSLSFSDTGLTGDASTAPSINGTGAINAQNQQVVTIYSASTGVISSFSEAIITYAGVCALTLAQPVAGAPSAGGQDGTTLDITDSGGHAHTVTTAANGIVGSKHVATFGGTANNTLSLVAYNGVWYVKGLGGCTLS